MSASLTGLVEYLARELVDKPDAVQISTAELPDETVIELRVDPADIGKIIGRQGRTVRALRTLLSAAAVKSQKRASLEIIE